MRFAPPQKLVQSLERVVSAHPFAKSGAIVPTKRVHMSAAALWKGLLECPSNELRQRISALTKQQKRLLIFAARPHFEHERAIDILALLYEAELTIANAGEIAWLAYGLGGARAVFKPTARSAFEQAGGLNTWNEIERAHDPIAALIELYQRSRKAFSAWSADMPAPVQDPLITAYLQRRLIRADQLIKTLKQESTTEVLEWVEVRLSDESRVIWFVDYLGLISEREWDTADAILHKILSRFGSPEDNRPFWANVGEKLREKFVIWIRDVELTNLLGKTDRLTFWREFLPYLKKSTRSRSGEAVFLDFGNWFAVQFIEMGRATYLLPISELRWLNRLPDPRLYTAVLDRREMSHGSYEHRGDHWRYRAARVVRDVLRRYGQ